MANPADKVVEKVEAIFNLLRIWRNENDGEESIYYPFASLEAFTPLLKDRLGVEKTLALIQRSTQDAISFSIRKGRLPHSDTAEQSDFRPTGGAPIGVEIHVDDPKKLEKYLNQTVKKLSGGLSLSNKIQLIEIIPDEEDTKTTLIINEQSEKPIKVSMRGALWSKFLEVAETGSARSEMARSVTDYFNTNKRCPLYSQTSYDLTEILIADHTQIHLARGVKIKIKGPKTIARRRNKRT